MSTTENLCELVIEHAAENGTTLTGTTKADDVYNLMRSLGWLFRRSHNDYRLQGSVDKPFKRGTVQRTVEALEKHFDDTVTVRVEADRELRSVADAEASIAEAADARADRLGNRADRLDALSEARAECRRPGLRRHSVRSAAAGRPPLLQGRPQPPERAWKQLGRSYELGREAAQAAAAAEVAGDRMRHRHTPPSRSPIASTDSARSTVGSSAPSARTTRCAACPTRAARSRRSGSASACSATRSERTTPTSSPT